MAGKKSKKFRVAVSGPTVDGREILPQDLRDVAATYNPNLYTGRVFVDHIRGLSADSVFPACGDVLDVEARDENGGVALYATIEANDKLIKFNAADQKVFPSIEIIKNFANTGKSYLGGLGITDTPASLGTERLSFSAGAAQREAGSGVFTSAAGSVALEFEGGDLADTFKQWLSEKFGTAPAPTPTPAPAPAPSPAPAPAPQSFDANTVAAAVSAQLLPSLGEGFRRMGDLIGDNTKDLAALAARVEAVEKYASTTDGNPSQRPTADGGGSAFVY